MKLSNKMLTRLIHGSIYNVRKDKGYMFYHRCNKEQIDYLNTVDKFLYDRTLSQASVTVEFDTDALSFSFDYKIFIVGSLDSFDIYVDGVPYKFITLENHIKQATVQVELPEGLKRVVMYLPCDSEVGIRDFCIDGKFKKVPNRKQKVLCYGDSITHGYGSLRSSLTYINVAAKELGWEVINQGIGGYWFDENYVCPIGDTKPDKILVSLGTNQLWSSDKYERIDKFFERLSVVFPNIPVLVISPIWRGDREEAIELIPEMKDYLYKTCQKFSNLSFVDGYTLIPHINYYFLDKLHPNGLGMEVYGKNLASIIKKINW